MDQDYEFLISGEGYNGSMDYTDSWINDILEIPQIKSCKNSPTQETTQNEIMAPAPETIQNNDAYEIKYLEYDPQEILRMSNELQYQFPTTFPQELNPPQVEYVSPLDLTISGERSTKETSEMTSPNAWISKGPVQKMDISGHFRSKSYEPPKKNVRVEQNLRESKSLPDITDDMLQEAALAKKYEETPSNPNMLAPSPQFLKPHTQKTNSTNTKRTWFSTASNSESTNPSNILQRKQKDHHDFEDTMKRTASTSETNTNTPSAAPLTGTNVNDHTDESDEDETIDLIEPINSADESEGSSSKKQRLKTKKPNVPPKPIPERFVLLNNSVTISESTTKSSNLMIEYGDSCDSNINKPTVDLTLCNKFAPIKHIEPYRGCVKPMNQADMKNNAYIAVGQRKRYVKEIGEDVLHSVANVVYFTTTNFDISVPYEPQYVRYELDEHGELENESKAGLCPYCPQVKFFVFKNSSYLNHLTLEHGIFSTNLLMPEGLYFGEYCFGNKKDPKKRWGKECKKTTAHRCPICLQLIELGIWANKTNAVLNYFRHFKKEHQTYSKGKLHAERFSSKIKVKSRGRKSTTKAKRQ